VIDVGSNIGQFARTARGLFPTAQIYSFEPLPDCFAALTQRFASDAKFRAFQVALGPSDSKVTFHQNEYSPSSSLLEMETLHQKSFPYAASQSEVTVPMRRLDDMLATFDLAEDILLKLDVQGYEDRVLDGAQRILRQSKLVITEVSFEPLYRDQVLFDAIYRRLIADGFSYHGNWEQLVSPLDGRILQGDAIFLRP
jgi:FkbM family methyltransferase